ncbi:unnamed protein product [Oikopleura dioica]|uniref:RanBD1 domain-containing protein n=1 Tax=Oikopleura dioica TaxID=34765 RepID=E4XWJ4_OIKDI|nr:unnamed protein product [Oikopleura dioica]
MSSNLKRQRPEANEPDSQELPTKKSELEGETSLLRPAAPFPSTRPSSGLFRRSFLPSVDLSQSETLQKLKEQQEAEKAKTPLVLLDPKSQFQPKDAEKFTVDKNLNGTKSSETATTFGKFENENSEKEDDKKEDEKKTEGKKSENSEEKPAEAKKLDENTEKELQEPTPRKPEPKKLNPFQKVASESAKSGGFGGLSITKSASDSTGLNPFQRLAQKSTTSGATSAWSGFASKSKEESIEIKEEAEKDENVSEKTSDTKQAKETTDKIVTGEEEEKNVLQVPCKLFQFDKKESTYSQRGRGTLRVNDCGEGSDFKSRLVFRTSGTQKVAMNSKIWASMSVEQVGPKSIRISAQDANTEGGVGIFLVQTALHDSKELYRAIDSRIIKMKTTESSN